MSKEFVQSVVDRAKRVLTEPGEFFKTVTREKGIDSALKYLSTVALVDVFFGSVLFSIGRGPLFFLSVALFSYIAIVVGLLIWALVLQLFALVLGGRGSYDATFRVVSYAYTPLALIGWIPIVGLLALLYALYLNVKGLSIVQRVSMWRSAAIVVMPAILAIAVMAFMAVVMAAVLVSLGLPTGVSTKPVGLI